MLFQGEELRPLLEHALGASIPAPARFIGKVVDGDAVSIAGLASWNGHDCEAFLWSAGTLHRDFIRAFGRYVWRDLECDRVSCRVAADNPWSEILPRLGFKLEGRMRRAFDG
jgi:RimJ/RimL family protein N-acetyltransferase